MAEERDGRSRGLFCLGDFRYGYLRDVTHLHTLTSEVNMTVAKEGNRQNEAMTFRGNLRTGRSEIGTLTSRLPLSPHTYWTVGWENARVAWERS
jgi:hypothetical protein